MMNKDSTPINEKAKHLLLDNTCGNCYYSQYNKDDSKDGWIGCSHFYTVKSINDTCDHWKKRFKGLG